MKRICNGLRKKSVALLASLTLVSSFSMAWAEDVQLFNGKDFSNWHGRPTLNPAAYADTGADKKDAWAEEVKKHWSIDGDEIVNDGHGAYLTTNEDYADFDFTFDYKLVEHCDSGVYVRGTPQIQIWDTTSENTRQHGAAKGSGGLWNNPADWPGREPLVHADNPTGQWNTMKIRMLGERCSVWLNDKLVVDHARLHNYHAKGEPLPKSGPIQLQTHGGEIRFKNLKLTTFNTDEANKLLKEADDKKLGDKKLTSLFNGKTLEGWEGATKDYTVVDGAIQCLKGKGGTLYTPKDYADFVARVEFQLPPGGNNGLAIRYPAPTPGQNDGGPAFSGMCELQVLDDGHEMYKDIDPRQAHGSAYGMVGAKRGYLRPTGEWNYQTVKVVGSKIKVELNGTVILDTDLSNVTEFMGDTPHPGKDNKTGRFGFAGHSDEVRFRTVEILELQ